MDKLIGAVLVVGGGIAGIQASLDLADMGFKVYLIETSSSIGGKMAQLDKTFPTNDCSMCILAPKMVECVRHSNIEILTYSDVVKCEGAPGNFTVTLNKKARYIDESKCISCGTCAEKCPVRNKVPNEFDSGLSYRRAAYKLFTQAAPSTYVIDKDHCIYLQKGKCGACKKYCEADAVDFEQKDELVNLKVGSVIIANGMEVFDPTPLSNFGYNIVPNVITSLQFERILSASGPFKGHILRPSDNRSPQKIAFIQCVGSRDRKLNRDFCSAACCMYAIKEAIIAREHDPTLDITIYYMDIRAFGKEFDEYYERAKAMGIKFIRSRPTSAQQFKDQIKVLYETRSGDLEGELFDLVVLSVGFQQSPKIKELSNIFGVELNEFGFIKTDSFNPLNTNIKGIQVCGICTGPKDIPDTVAQASGAVSQSASLLASVKGTLIEKVEEAAPAKEIQGVSKPRIGVVICRCGNNIGGVVEVPEVVEFAKSLPNVVTSEERIYSCSSDSIERIKEMIQANNLNRFIVASCTPRTHESLFANTCKEAGMNPYLFEMVNIREQDSWVHESREAATKKAKTLVAGAVSRAALLEPLARSKVGVTPSALVIGGGIAGIQAALEIANNGYKVYLIEKTAQLGGLLNNIHYLFEDEDPQKFLADKIQELRSNNDIQVFLNSELAEITGFVGNFKAQIQKANEIQEVEIGAIVVATGAEVYKPVEYLYGEDDRIVTCLELEESLANKTVEGKTFCFIQCVGSRNEEHPYCNRICCTEAIKNAIRIKETISDSKVFVLYRDVRIYGFNEKYYTKARDLGVVFINFDQENPPEVESKNNKISVKVYDEILQRNLMISPDKLILSVGVEQKNNSKLSKMLKVPLNKDGFFLEAHMKLRPVDFATDGIFLCGSAHWPKLIPECISQASAAATRAVRLLSTPTIETEGIISEIISEKCRGCGFCVEVCPYNAIELKEVNRFGHMVTVASINEALCKGCGSCNAVCLSGAIEQRHFKDNQILAMISTFTQEAKQ